MIKTRSVLTLMVSFVLSIILATSQAGSPAWTFAPLTPTTLTLSFGDIGMVQYQVTNQSHRVHQLMMPPLPGVTASGTCSLPFGYQQTCLLTLTINSQLLTHPIADGPVLCQQGNLLECYRPSPAHRLHITQAPPLIEATISVTGSPLVLTANGVSGSLTITNRSTQVTATNITTNLTATALSGQVTEMGNTCEHVPPGGHCLLTYTPGHNVVAPTALIIQGTNTNIVTAVVAIQSGSTLTAISPVSGTASGGTGFTLTGTGLIGAIGVTFDGLAATSVNVVDSMTVTGVTPAHVLGVVDVVIETSAGGAQLTSGYTYLPTTVGQASGGGTIACLNGGLNNLIAATSDNSTGIQWGGSGTTIGAGAQSNTDGATNTAAIVACLTGSGGGMGCPMNFSIDTYAAGLCSNYQVDSQGHTPCQAGNTCYDDWFLPAGNNTSSSGQLNCLYINHEAIGGFSSIFYWSSTESSGHDSTIDAWGKYFDSGLQGDNAKNGSFWVRCVRAFTP